MAAYTLQFTEPYQ